MAQRKAVAAASDKSNQPPQTDCSVLIQPELRELLDLIAQELAAEYIKLMNDVPTEKIREEV